MKNHYKILEVAETASLDEIRKAYKKLAIKLHPDKHRNSEEAKEAFQELAEAYEVLSDEKKRAKYDEKSNHNSCMSSLGAAFSVAARSMNFFASCGASRTHYGESKSADQENVRCKRR